MAGLLLLWQKTPAAHQAVVAVVYLAVLLSIAGVDILDRRAPNRLVYPGLVFALLASLSFGPGVAPDALLGGATAFALFLMIALVGRGAMGMGDVKVAALCGIVVGIHGMVPLLAFTFLTGMVVSLVLLVLRLRSRKDTIAFTPFLVLATFITLARYNLYLLG